MRTVLSLLTAVSLATLGAAGCGKVKDNGDNDPDATPTPDAGQVCSALVTGVQSSIPVEVPAFTLEIADTAYFVTAEFFAPVAGTFDLTAGVDANYSTCVNCFRATLDDEAGGTTVWFQSGGTLTLNEAPMVSQLSGTVTDLTLIEVTISEDGTLTSTPVEGGTCLSLGSFPLSVTPPPVPANDSCSAAVAIAVPSNTGGTTIGSLNDIEEGITSCTAYPQKGGDVSYKVPLTAGIAYQFTVTPTADFPDFDSSLALLGPGNSAVCTEPVACLVGADQSLGGLAETFSYTPSSSGDYFLIVDSYLLAQSGDFIVSVTLAP